MDTLQHRQHIRSHIECGHGIKPSILPLRPPEKRAGLPSDAPYVGGFNGFDLWLALQWLGKGHSLVSCPESGVAWSHEEALGSREHACLQVYISYGQKTSGQLLLSYGFMPAPGSNPHDACLLELSLAEDDPCYQAKAACLRQHGVEPAREFPLRLDALPRALLLFAAFRDARPSGAAEVMALAKQLFETVGLEVQHFGAFCKQKQLQDVPCQSCWQLQRVRQL